MKIKIPFKLAPAFITLLLVWQAFPAFAQVDQIMYGRTVQKDRQVPLEGVSIVNMRSGQAAISDSNGLFLISVQKEDSLLIRSLGFKDQVYTVKNKPTVAEQVQIVLEETSVQLKEVEITSLPSPEELMRNLGKKKAAGNYVRNPYIPKPEPRVIPTETGVSLGSPISALYGMLSKEGKQLRKLEELKQKEKEEQELKEKQKYNRFFKDNTGYE